MTFSRFLAVFGAVFAFTFPLLALDPSKTVVQYAHRIWGQEEGLFQPTIYSISQTPDGFLWLGTQDSLIRFDGVHFREFPQAGEAGLHDSLIRSLLVDRAGDLWAGSIGNGLARIAPNGVVKRFSARDNWKGDSAFCLSSDSQGNIWTCTNQGLARFDNGRFTFFTTADGLVSNQVRQTCEATDHTRWVAELPAVLSHWDGHRFVSYSGPRFQKGDLITALVCSSDGSVWAGGNFGLLRIRDGVSRLFTVADGLPDNAISSLMEGENGAIWVGTNDGISRYQDDEFSIYRTRDGLSHSSVLSLFQDREGTLWAGTKDGLDQFTNGKVTPFTTNEGMSSNDAGPVIEDAEGRLWVGTLGHGLNYFDGKRFRVLTRRNGLASNTILSLERDPKGDLWVGTNTGVNRLRAGKVIATYLSGVAVQALTVDADGVLWAGTDKGLNRLKDERFEPVKLSPGNIGVLALMRGHAVKLFASRDNGDFYWLRDGVFTNYALNGVARPVDCYYTDPTRRGAWLGTLGSGLLRWENEKITHVWVKDGLYDNRIYSILKDDSGNFWMASSKGIFRVGEKELEDFTAGKIRSITSIPFSTGQLRFECRSGVQPAAYKTHDGRLWFSTTNGLVVVDPNHLRTNPVPPPVQIAGVYLNGQRVNEAGGIDVKPLHEKNIEIRYSGLSFVSPEKVSFRYIMRGYDKTWTDAGPRREAFFTNLPPGEFHFEVIARNADGIWSPKPAVLSLTIEPRLYQRTWFFPLVGVFLGLGITAGYRMRIRRLKRTFNVVIAERSRIARELHDTLLQGLSGVTMQLQALWSRLPPSKERAFLHEIIQDAGRCSTEARQSLWGLRSTEGKSAEFSDKLADLAKRAMASRQISLTLEIAPVTFPLSPEVQYQLVRIASEIFSNILKHAEANSVVVRLSCKDRVLQLTIEDDGVGFDTKQDRFDHFGLTGIEERALEIGADLDILSAPGYGTRVSLRLNGPNVHAPSNLERTVQHQIK